MTADFERLPMPIDYWQARIHALAPNPGDVAVLTADDVAELARLRGSRRLPRLLFGRQVARPLPTKGNTP